MTNLSSHNGFNALIMCIKMTKHKFLLIKHIYIFNKRPFIYLKILMLRYILNKRKAIISKNNCLSFYLFKFNMCYIIF